MLYRLLLLLATCILPLSISAQLPTTAILLQQAEDSLLTGRIPAALHLAEDALVQSQRQENILQQAEAHQLAGRVYMHEAAYGQALEHYLKSIDLLDLLDLPQELVAALSNTGKLLRNWGDSKRALSYFSDAYGHASAIDATAPQTLVLLERVAETQRESGLLEESRLSYQKLINLAASMARPAEQLRLLAEKIALEQDLRLPRYALQSYRQKLQLHRYLGDIVGESESIREIGHLYLQLKDYHNSYLSFIEYQSLQGSISNSNNNSEDKAAYARALASLGQVQAIMALESKKPEQGLKQALTYLQLSQSQKKLIDDKAGLAEVGVEIAQVLLSLNDRKEARREAEAALQAAIQSGDKKLTSDSYNMLATLYEQQGKHRDALDNYKNQSVVQDSLLVEQLDKHYNELLANLEQSQKVYLINNYEQLVKSNQIQQLALERSSLQNEKTAQQLKVLEQQRILEQIDLENARLQREKAEQKSLLVEQQLENQRQKFDVQFLNFQKELKQTQHQAEQEQVLTEKQSLEAQNKLKELEIMQAKKSQDYFILGTAAASILVLLLLLYLRQTRKTNKKLSDQKHQIEQQTHTLRLAYQNLELLGQIGRDVTATLSASEITDIVYKNVNQIMPAQIFGIGIYKPELQIIEFTGAKQNGETLPLMSFPTAYKERFAVKCLLEQREVMHPNVPQQLSEQVFTGSGGFGLSPKSVVYLPLVVHKQVLGVLTVQNEAPYAFSSYHYNMLRNLAVYVGIALENAKAYQQLEQKKQWLSEAHENIRGKKQEIERKNLELFDLNHEKNHLIGMVAHDLRNPLSTGKALIDFIKQQPANLSAQQQKGIEILEKALAKMDDMILRTLDIRAIERRELNLQLKAGSPTKLMQRLVEQFEQIGHHKKITLKLEAEEDLVASYDENYLQQVYENLLSNAYKFSEKGTHISVKLRQVDDKIRTEITDQGPGITEEDQKKLFRRYQVLSARPTSGEQSIGLGLSIVKKFTELMHGEVWCVSEAGKGATFVVELNACPEGVSCHSEEDKLNKYKVEPAAQIAAVAQI